MFRNKSPDAFLSLQGFVRGKNPGFSHFPNIWRRVKEPGFSGLGTFRPGKNPGFSHFPHTRRTGFAGPI